MTQRAFRFVHAADFHLERPLFGLTETPDHLRDLLVDCPYRAAERVFQVALAEQADFLVLSGDLLDPLRTGPRGPLFLIEQFERLAERGMNVYWSGGQADPPDAWPLSLRLPENVHLFPAGQTGRVVEDRDGEPLAALVGASSSRVKPVSIDAIQIEPGPLFTIAAIHTIIESAAVADRDIDYWALGGEHNRRNVATSSCTAHYPGSPQGREPAEAGPHGCTVVEINEEREVRLVPVAADLVRFENQRLVVDESTARSDLEARLHAQARAIRESARGTTALVWWTIVGEGRLADQIRRGSLGDELLRSLRTEFGVDPPVVWSAAITVEPPAVMPSDWYEQETIRGEFLRTIRQYQMRPDQPLDLAAYLGPQAAGVLGPAATLGSTAAGQRVLREAALLGVDLLSGEEPLP